MIDIHSHILYGLDDGAPTLDEAVRMAALYAAGNTGQVAATPHFIQGSLESAPDLVQARVTELNQTLNEEGSKVTIFPGMEIEISLDIPALFRENRLLTLNKSRYILIELPFSLIPQWTHQVLFELSLMGLVPVLAHPERNREIAANPCLAHQLVEKGILIQVNGGSLLGCFGGQVKKAAFSLLQSGHVHFIAGDAHRSTGGRAPCLNLVRPLLENTLGSAGADILLEMNPAAVIQDRPITWPEPAVPRKSVSGFLKRLFGNQS